MSGCLVMSQCVVKSTKFNNGILDKKKTKCMWDNFSVHSLSFMFWNRAHYFAWGKHADRLYHTIIKLTDGDTFFKLYA